MKGIVLFLLRVTTGGLLIIWGLIKAMAPGAAQAVSDKYYAGYLSADALQFPLGAAQVILGLLVILGVMRSIVYPIQALVLGAGALAIWQYLVDPLGLYLLTAETRQVLFFPSSTVFIAALVLLAFKRDDVIAVDTLFGK